MITGACILLPVVNGKMVREGLELSGDAINAIEKTTIMEFDIVRYGDKAPGFEKHHGVLDSWTTENVPGYVNRSSEAPTMTLTEGRHNATRSEFMKWKHETYGGTTASVDWKSVSAPEIQSLSERLFDIAGVPIEAREQYYGAFNKYIYNLKGDGLL